MSVKALGIQTVKFLKGGARCLGPNLLDLYGRALVDTPLLFSESSADLQTEHSEGDLREEPKQRDSITKDQRFKQKRIFCQSLSEIATLPAC